MRDYEVLVKRLKTCAELHGECSLCIYQGNPCDCMPETPLEEAANAIEDLISLLTASNEVVANRRPKWISVEERLPGTGEIVLVYGKRGGIYTAEHNRNARWPGTFWKLNSKSHHCEPTHWMPLPESPKGDAK